MGGDETKASARFLHESELLDPHTLLATWALCPKMSQNGEGDICLDITKETRGHWAGCRAKSAGQRRRHEGVVGHLL